MNLASQIRLVRTRLAEPARVDSADEFATDLEILEWITQAEMRVINDLDEREQFIAKKTAFAISGDLDDALDVVRVEDANGIEVNRIPVHEMGALTNNTLYRNTTGWNPYFYVTAGANGALKLGCSPGVTSVTVYYVKRPARRFKQVTSTTTGAGSLTTLIDTSLVQGDTYWAGCGLRILSGDYSGTEKTVTTWVKVSGTLTVPAFTTTFPGAGVDYEMGELSTFSDDFMAPITAWSTYLGLMKDKEQQLASVVLAEYQSDIQQRNQRYFKFRVEPSRSPSTPRMM